ncbi:MAG: DUF3524 domain-containing protein [Holophagales bacterium]|nr:DUF3524 domain-containing protein [Holophagales bacterium]
MPESADSDPRPSRVLALEPYYGGSHRAFLDGWRAHSRHAFTLLTLPAHHWKWRMRHGAVTLAEAAARLPRNPGGPPFHALFTSSMLDLASWRGLAPPGLAALPALAYFHENQLTYPVRREEERDLHFAFTHLTTALSAERVAWNSAYHRDDFLAALERLLARMPDHAPRHAVSRIRARSVVLPQGLDLPRGSGTRRRPGRPDGPLRIVWAARWEFDKNPGAFFRALHRLEERRVPYRVSVLGQSFHQVPEEFTRAREALADHIDAWGYVEEREAYWRILAGADVFVSTADHEFFGVAAAEAMAAGCRPLLPDRLAYPELLSGLGDSCLQPFLYAGDDLELAEALEALARRLAATGSVWASEAEREAVAAAMAPCCWPALAPRLDAELTRLAADSRNLGTGPSGDSHIRGRRSWGPSDWAGSEAGGGVETG